MKSKIKYLCFMTLIFLMPYSVIAEDYKYRGKEMGVIYIAGICLMIIKIAVPIALIAVGMFGLLSAMAKSDDREMAKEIKKLIPKVILAVVIFLLPSVIAFLLKLTNQRTLWNSYSKCLLKPSECKVDLWKKD